MRRHWGLRARAFGSRRRESLPGAGADGFTPVPVRGEQADVPSGAGERVEGFTGAGERLFKGIEAEGYWTDGLRCGEARRWKCWSTPDPRGAKTRERRVGAHNARVGGAGGRAESGPRHIPRDGAATGRRSTTGLRVLGASPTGYSPSQDRTRQEEVGSKSKGYAFNLSCCVLSL